MKSFVRNAGEPVSFPIIVTWIAERLDEKFQFTDETPYIWADFFYVPVPAILIAIEFVKTSHLVVEAAKLVRALDGNNLRSVAMKRFLRRFERMEFLRAEYNKVRCEEEEGQYTFQTS